MSLEKLKIDDVEYLKRYLHQIHPQLSPYSLSEIFLWDGCFYDVYIAKSRKGPFIVEIPHEKDQEKRLLFPFPLTHPSFYSPAEIKEILCEIDVKTIYYAPYEYLIANPDLEKYFEIYEQPEYYDYLYDSQSLAKLEGSKYSSKRNLIKQFESQYRGLYEIKNFSNSSLDDIMNLWHHTQNQISTTDLHLKILQCEKKAIENISRYINLIDFFGVSLYINNKIKAFAIGSHLNNTTCLLNFEKADKNIKGLYQFIDREFARLVSTKYKYINKESDLGKETLKKAKLSYHPIKIIKSYKLVLKEE